MRCFKNDMNLSRRGQYKRKQIARGILRRFRDICFATEDYERKGQLPLGQMT